MSKTPTSLSEGVAAGADREAADAGPSAREHAAFRANNRFGSLDGLRALSVAAVIWHHSGSGFVASEWAQHGHHGVTLFFAISGFLITTLLLRERDRHGAIDLRAFYIRRALRIFPLYYAVLLIYVVLVFALERHSKVGQDFFSNLVYFATYTSNWFVALDGRVIFYFSWSLAAEEQFYLVWPPLMKRLGTRGRALAVVLTVIVVIALLDVLLPRWLPASPAAQTVLDVVHNIPLAIIVGVAAALLLHHPKGFARCWTWLAGSRWHCLLWLVLSVAAALTPGAPWFTIHVALAMLVVACCMREDHALAPLLQLPVLAYLGTISYGLYLLHMLCKNFVGKVFAFAGVELGAFTSFLATLLLSIVVAGLSYRYFESRFLRLKGRFERGAPAATAKT
jgi:peptidoglycan/LPS O-acetylase OafA/YrhL